MKDCLLIALIGLQREGLIHGQTPSCRRDGLMQHIIPRQHSFGQDIVSRLIQFEVEHIVSFGVQHRKGCAHLSLHGKQTRVGIHQHRRVIALALRDGHGDWRVLDQVALGHLLHDRPDGDILDRLQHQGLITAPLGVRRDRAQLGIPGPHLKHTPQRFGQPLSLRVGVQSAKIHRQGGLLGHAGKGPRAQQAHAQQPRQNLLQARRFHPSAASKLISLHDKKASNPPSW